MGAISIESTYLKDAGALTIASGAITPTQEYCVVSAESGTSDDLDSINVSGFTDLTLAGITYRPSVLIKAASGHTITLKHGTGNISLGTAADHELSGDAHVRLFYDGTNYVTTGMLVQEYSAGVYRTTNQSIPNATNTNVIFDTEAFDNGDMVDLGTNNERVTIPFAGRYQVSFSVEFASNATGRRRIVLRKNGVSGGAGVMQAIDVAASGVNDTEIGGSRLLNLAANDYLELEIYQDSGGALDILGNTSGSAPFLTVYRVG